MLYGLLFLNFKRNLSTFNIVGLSIQLASIGSTLYVASMSCAMLFTSRSYCVIIDLISDRREITLVKTLLNKTEGRLDEPIFCFALFFFAV